MSSATARRSSILQQLRSVPAGATAAELALRLGVTERTIYRDVAVLRATGEPVVADRGRGGGIRLLPGTSSGGPSGIRKPVSQSVAHGPHGVFVGRDREIKRLDDLFARTQTGTGGVVMLVGEPGIGKSHTAQEFASRASRAGAAVLWGRCRESEGSPPFWPWIQIIRTWVESSKARQLHSAMGPGASDIAELVPEVSGLLPDLTPTPRLKDPAAAQFRLFDSIARFLKALAAERPLLLILDDLQWADAPSLSLLEFVAVEAVSSPIAILGTYRDGELGRHHPLSQTLSELPRSVQVDRLALSGMSRDEVGRYVLQTTGIQAQHDFIAAVHERTNGNPLFVGEYIRLLVQPDDGNDAGHIPELSLQGQIPQGVRDVVGRRLNRLSEDCNEVLTVAAVISLEFGLPELKQVVELDEVAILEALESATRAQIIEPAGTTIGRYQFRHDLVRQTLYEELSTLDRVQLHRSVGNAIETLRRPNLEPVLPQLAFHYFEAARSGDTRKAVKYCADAGRQALDRLAGKEAARYCRMAIQALELSGPADPHERCELLLVLGEACRAAGDFTEAMVVFREVCELTRATQTPTLLAKAALGFEETSWRPGMPGNEAAGFLESALEAIPLEDGELRIQLMASLYRALVFAGERERAGRVWLDSVEMARRLEAPEMLKTALRVRLFDRGRGSPDERLAVASEVIELATITGDVDTAIEAGTYKISELIELGEFRSVVAELGPLQESIERTRNPFLNYVRACFVANLDLFAGRFSDAEKRAGDAYAIGQKLGGHDPLGMFGVQMFTLRREQGRLRELEPAVSGFVQQSESALWRPGLALIYTDLGLIDKAREQFEIMVKSGFRVIPRDAMWAGTLAYLSEVCFFVDDEVSAALLYELLLPSAAHNITIGVPPVSLGPASRYLGLLSVTVGEWDLGEHHFEAAVAMCNKMGSPPLTARTQLDLVEACSRRGDDLDVTRALDVLEEASATAARFGMRSLLEKSGSLRTRLGARKIRQKYPDGLSPREVEVLRLIAAGNGNRNIAEQLFITPNTVANHVKSIFSKTGSANRAEAAAYAVRNQLERE